MNLLYITATKTKTYRTSSRNDFFHSASPPISTGAIGTSGSFSSSGRGAHSAPDGHFSASSSSLGSVIFSASSTSNFGFRNTSTSSNSSWSFRPSNSSNLLSASTKLACCAISKCKWYTSIMLSYICYPSSKTYSPKLIYDKRKRTYSHYFVHIRQQCPKHYRLPLPR